MLVIFSMKIQILEKKFEKRIQNYFFNFKTSFEFFLNVAIYNMKTDGKKLKETLKRKKEIKKHKQ